MIPSLEVTTCDADPPLPPELLDALRDLVGDVGPGRALKQLQKRPRPLISGPTRALVFDRCNARCVYCDRAIGPRTKWQIDHVVPRSKGGTDDPDNLVVSCPACNAAKADNLGYICPDCEGYAWVAAYARGHQRTCERRAIRQWMETA
jgi:hypothetical protein